MKMFTKGNLETVVEDDDRRIKDYLKSGWKEESFVPKEKTDADKRKQRAIDEAIASEDGSEEKSTQGDVKTNDAIAAAETAHAEGEPVDDGLFKKEAE